MKRTSLILLASLFLVAFSTNGNAQNRADSTFVEYETMPFQFTFMCPPFSTNGPDNSEIINDVSINLFAGVSGGVDGVELGGFMNVDRYYVNGFQAAGFANFVGGDVDGIQAAGFCNLNGGSTRYIQGAGFMNVVGGSVYGIQGAGFGNFTDGKVTGVQGAGFMNMAGDTVSGIQGAGFINIAEAANRGIQGAGFGNIVGDGKISLQGAGFFNIADEVEGLQAAGFINKANYVKGAQVAGFINICDSIDGVPIGLFNIVKHGGYRSLEIATSETQLVSASFRMGVERLYTIFSIGKSYGHENLWMSGIGVGSQFSLNRGLFLNVEAMSEYQMWIANSDLSFPVYWDRFNTQNQLRALFGFRLGNVADVFVGPTVNIAIANTNTYSGTLPWEPIAPKWTIYNHTRGNQQETNISMWFGLRGGIRF